MTKNELIELVATSHGIDKITKEIKACYRLKCDNCIYNGADCYSRMYNHLLGIDRESEDKIENTI